MRTSRGPAALALAVGGWLGIGQAQPMIGLPGIGPPAPEVLLSTQFHTPLAYAAAIARLDEYYDEQVGRKAAAAFPQIAPKQHFELWHDMWVSFDPGDPDMKGGGMKVTIKRPAGGLTGRLLVKSWMVNLAGRIDAPLPLEFEEGSPLHWVEGDLYCSPKDLARVLQSDAGMRPLATWEHAGLVASAKPMVSVILAPAGLHGIHHLTVTAESTATAKLLLNRVMQEVLKPGIYAAYSEDIEIEEEIQKTAKGKAESVGAANSQAIYIPLVDPALIEAKLRADPEMHRRMLAAQNHYDVRFRIGKPYGRLVVNWTELAGYSRNDGKYQGEHMLGKTAIAAQKVTPQSGSLLIARTKLENLQPGAYRVTVEGGSYAGALSKIDERTYWFDGKSFEEL